MAEFLGTKTVLTANSIFTSDSAGWRTKTDWSDSIVGTVFSDQGGTVHIEQGPDGQNWDARTSVTVTANTVNQGFNVPVVAPFFRIRYVNGGVDQTTFRLNARLNSAGPR